MAQIRTKDTVDAVKELVSQLTPIYIIKEAIDNGDGTFTLSTNRTYWLTINKRITIDSIEYRITAFEINVSITIKPITTGDPIPTVTFFTIPAPLFFHGVTLMAIDEQGKPKDPNQRTPFIWLYEILDETVIQDEFDPWGRNSKPQLFFMDESSLADWTSAQHKTNVLEPMRQMVELFFEKINDFQGDKYKEVLTSSQIGRANWGKFITDLGSVKKFFNEDLSGHQVGFDFTMSKTECDTRSANPVTCNLTAQVTTIPETGVGTNDGIAIATPVGGIGPYTYSWSGPSAYSSNLQCIVDLVPGVYTVVITDTGVESCSDQESGTVAAAGGACNITIDSITPTETTEYQGTDGTATAVVSGNIGSIAYYWSDGQTTNPAVGLPAGTIGLTVLDLGILGCAIAGEATIIDGILPLITNVSTWLDASDTSTINAGSPVLDDPVETWADKTANGYDATQSTPSARPLWKTTYIQAYGNDFLDMGTVLSKMPIRTVFCVFRADSFSGNPAVFGDYSSGGIAANASLALRVNAAALSTYGDGINYRVTNGNDSFIVGTDALYNDRYTSGSGPLVRMQIDGEDITETNGGGTATNIGGSAESLALFRLGGAFTGIYLTGRIYEFIVYDVELSDANNQVVSDYLTLKYGL